MSQGFKDQRGIPLWPGEHFKISSSGLSLSSKSMSLQELLDFNSCCPIIFIERILDFQNLQCSLSSSLASFAFFLLYPL